MAPGENEFDTPAVEQSKSLLQKGQSSDFEITEMGICALQVYFEYNPETAAQRRKSLI